MSPLTLIAVFSLLAIAQSQPGPPKGTLIDCGATVDSVIDGRRWVTDAGFVSVGTPKNVTGPGLLPVLSTVRSFPLGSIPRQKFCFDVPVFRDKRYLVRTTYFYGGVNGRKSPPVFDQIVGGTFWGVVNTTEDYAKGLSSYYEGVFPAQGKTISVCLAGNTYTESDPFISALELVLLGDSLYNSTDFSKFGLSLVARNSFGYSGPAIRYPDDQFDRFWRPFGENNSTLVKSRSISASSIWNMPPSKIFDTVLAKKQPGPLEFQWPQSSLPNSTYYIALYFADDRTLSSEGPMTFNVSINGVVYYRDLIATPAGAVVFATKWPLSGPTKITLTPNAGSNAGPVISAGEIFDILLLGRRTVTRDVIALNKVKNSLQNSPRDWNGDPCLPREYSWTGVTCSFGHHIRVVALNLTSMGLSGSLSPSIANLTALTEISLGNNTLSGSIPNLSALKMLQILHLEGNQFSGEIPSSLGGIGSLRELFVQENNLTGQVPHDLVGKPGLNLKTLPGNHFWPPPLS